MALFHTEEDLSSVPTSYYVANGNYPFESHYAGYIRSFSKVNGQVNAEVEDYVKQQLIAALFKFRYDR